MATAARPTRRLAGAVVLLVLGALLSSVCWGSGGEAVSVVSPMSGRVVEAAPGRLLVRLREPAGEAAAAAVGAGQGVARARFLPDGRLGIVELAPGAQLAEVLRSLKADPRVLTVEPDYAVRVCIEPNDPLWERQCGLRRLACPGAWNTQRGRPDVVIAILDTGVAYDHPDLAANLHTSLADPPDRVDNDGNGFIDDFRGWDFVDGDNDPHADRGDGVGHAHGTHVAGIAAAVTNNRLGMAGVGWSCRFLPVRVLNHAGSGYLSDVARGIEYATDQGAKVINVSLEGPYSQAFQAAIDYAYRRGAVLCAAVGNGRLEFTADPATWTSPACNDGDVVGRDNEVIGVAAVDCNNVKRPSSSYGQAYSFVDLTAPGANIRSTYWPGNDYADLSGTSQAAPHVAAGAALLVAQFGPVGPSVVTQLLRGAADNIDSDNPGFVGKLGAGRANLARALRGGTDGPVVATSVAVDDASGGNGNGRAEPGETAVLRIGLRNLGTVLIEGASGHLISGSAGVTVTQPDVSYGDLAPGALVSPTSGFGVRVAPGVAPGTQVGLALEITGPPGTGPWQDVSRTLKIGWDAFGEPDGSAADAFPAVLGTLYDRELAGAADEDWFALDAVMGGRYILVTSPRSGSSPDTYLAVRDLDGGELAADDDSGYQRCSRLDWVCPASGRYLVMVNGSDRHWTGAYSFRARFAGTVLPGPVAATALVVDDDRSGASVGDGDGRAEAGETVEVMVEVTNEGPLPVTGVSAELASPRRGLTVLSGEAAFGDLGGGRKGWSAGPFVVRLAGALAEPAWPSLQFHVTSTEGSWDSELPLVVGRKPYGEPDNRCYDGPVLYPNEPPQPRRFETLADQDWVLFDALAGGSYVIETQAFVPPGETPVAVDTTLSLHDVQCGRRLVFDDNGAGGGYSRIAWTCSVAGRYSVVAKPAPGSAAGPYALALTLLSNIGPGEPDDTCSEAALIPADGIPQARDFAVHGDEDWVGFEGQAGTTYVIETLPAPGWPVPGAKAAPSSEPVSEPPSPDTILQLFAPGCGAELAADDDGGVGLFSRLVFVPQETSVHSLRVTEYWDGVGPYLIRIRMNTAPVLTFTDRPGFTGDIVHPDQGLPDTTRFVFRVRYTDADGDPPVYVRVRLLKEGVPAGVSPLVLAKVAGQPATGIGYRGECVLPPGRYVCWAEASDGLARAQGPATQRRALPVSNTPPRLTWTGEAGYESEAFQPDSGVRNTTVFTFAARYSDAEGTPPVRPRLRLYKDGAEVSGSPQAMTEVDPGAGDYIAGKVFTASRTLGLGTWTYLIDFGDGLSAAEGEAAGLHAGPRVVDYGFRPAVITSLTAVPGPNRLTEVRFAASAAGRVTLRILNVAGREVAVVVRDSPTPSGLSTLLWSGASSTGTPAPPGAYLLELTLAAGNGATDRRLMAFRLE